MSDTPSASPARGPLRWLDRLSGLIGLASGYVAVAMTLVMLAVLTLQIVARYFFGVALSWSEELSLLLFTWVVLLVGSLGVREGFHVRLTLLLDALPPGAGLWLNRLLDAAILVFGVYLALAGYDYVEATMGQTSAAIAYPIEALHMAAPVCGGLIALHALSRILVPLPPRAAVPEVE
ncbi:TRAP transporter small permease [Oceanibaculum pacificum]|uniref:TRAP transporter small permease n=1 Tax=Oceanibaculum pacificum TaxID=580166 RepID=UPI0012ED49E0|nr:TRAP transporter small permease [Oceanibaculum pacificum]